MFIAHYLIFISYQLTALLVAIKKSPDIGSTKQQLALEILRTSAKPAGDKTSTELDLVPEHIETRSLSSPAHPGFTQVNLKLSKTV